MLPSLTPHLRASVVVAVVAALTLAITLHGPVAQPLDYHQFADARDWLGIANALNVLSNLPFVFVGVIGLGYVARLWSRRGRSTVVPYLVMFVGVGLTGVGSIYYHLAPSNESLVWDRVPMTIAFAGFLAAAVSELVNRRLGHALLVPLLAAGLLSVWYWIATERVGAGDVRWYLLVQLLPVICVPLLLALYPRPQHYVRYLGLLFVFYAASKICEFTDAALFASNGWLSGHTLKHLFSAAAVACVLPLLHQRLKH